jgi:hypothetical protein
VVKNLAEFQKVVGNFEGIWKFVEKVGSRYKIRIKLDEIFSSYLLEIDILFPLPPQKKLPEKLMNNLSFSLQYFYIYILISIINMLICIKIQ